MTRMSLPRMMFFALLFTWAASLSRVNAQQVHRNGFETGKTAWQKSGFDAPHDVIAHNATDQGAHDGQRSEYLQLNSKLGNFIYYQYPVGKAPITAELVGGIFVKSNRPGIQVLARVVLPNERDPSNLEYRMTTTIRGEVYRNVGRWQRLDLGRATQLAKQQQQLLQAELKREINFADAYVDALLINVYAGPGPTELWIDDLEIGPVLEDSAIRPIPAAKSRDTPTKQTNIPRPSAPGPGASVPGGRGEIVEFNSNKLLVGGKPFLMRAVNHSNTPLKVLQQAGFNTTFVDDATNAQVLKEAAELGLWIAPRLRILSSDATLVSSEGIQAEVAKYSSHDAVLMWHMGGTLAHEQTASLTRAVQVVRGADPGRPLGAEVWDGMLSYSRNLNMLGIHRWPLMTTLELPKYRDWLTMRRNLANPDAYVWTWIQNHVPDSHTQLLYERGGNAGFAEPVGPQPEQLRLLTYTALAAGVRGLGFWSDRWLADSHQGRDRLLMCGILNQELDMLEPLLLTAAGDPQWIETSSKDVRAAVFQTGKGILVLPMWHGAGAQFVPGQAAVSKLTITVPQVPQTLQCWEVTPGEVRSLRAERVPGGSKVTIPEFGLTTALVFTADTNLIVRFQEMAKSRRQLAAQWTYDMAVYELQKAVAIEKELQAQGHTLPDSAALIYDAQRRLDEAKNLWDNGLFAEAYREGQRALRPVRILMRAQWEEATKNLDSPVSSPYAVSFFTLPRHWQFMSQVGRATPASNVLPGGNFEIVPQRKQEAWRIEEPTLDEVELTAVRVAEVKPPNLKKDKKNKEDGKAVKGTLTSLRTDVEEDDAKRPAPNRPAEGKQCAMLQIKPKNPKEAPHALERSLVAITSPTVYLAPGTLVQVSGWISIPDRIKASADGALFYDSVGGEPLAIRLTEPMAWKRFTLYRRVPPGGAISVTLALTGLGTVYFDDIRIEPLTPASNTAAVR
jgi:hypothetical protein